MVSLDVAYEWTKKLNKLFRNGINRSVLPKNKFVFLRICNFFVNVFVCFEPNKAKFHGSAFRKQRINACGSREFSAYVQRIS